MQLSVELENIGQKFGSDWVFRNINLKLKYNHSYAIIGSNGSGKSTLLSVLSGFQTPTTGKIEFILNNNKILEENIFKYISISAPYISLVEEYTLAEMINFHFSFCDIISGENVKSLIKFIYLEKNENKLIKNFSSGMKQRLKLGLSLFTNKPILLLDEPTVNLDAEGINWYKTKILPFANNKLTVICSNQSYEYEHCDEIIHLNNYKN